MKLALQISMALVLFATGCAGGASSRSVGEASRQPIGYTVTDLGTLGGTASIAFGINNAGRVGGGANVVGEDQHPFLWDQGQMIDLGTLGGLNGNAGGPNERDEMPVLAETSTPDPLGEDFCGYGTKLTCLGAFWKDGALTALSTLGGNNGQAVFINNRSQVVGFAENGTRDPSCLSPQALDFQGVIWEPLKGEIHELPPLPGDSVGFALGINDKGQAVGSSGTCANTPLVPLPIGPHAVLWDNGVPTDLGSLGGKLVSTAAAITNRGEIVGGSNLADDKTLHSFLWTQAAGMQDIGTVGADVSSLPTAINNSGHVVGASCETADYINGPCRAYIWENGVMTDLNDLIPPDSSLHLIFAFGINDAGQIVGQAVQKSTGQFRAFLATPESSEVGSQSAAPGASRGTGESALP